MPDAISYEVRSVAVDRVRPLRHALLRAGRPVADSEYPQDDLAETIHLAATTGEEVIGCLTLFPEDYEGEPAWRIRGMATTPALQRQGLGRALVAAAQAAVVEGGGTLIWCNARSTVLDFYRRSGFEIVGPEFIAERVPHRVAVWRLNEES
jgi:predicted GNAT family N-acyltransferase